MIRKFLTSVAVAGLCAGAASALGLENLETTTNVNEQYPLADSLDFATAPGVTTTIDIGFGPSAGSFPTGNVLVFVDVTGGTFTSALTGAEVTGTTTMVISSGGLSGGSSVVFLVSGAENCMVDANAVVTQETDCAIGLPLALTGDDVTVSIGLETDAGAAVDNSDSNNKVTLNVVDIVPAFDIDIVADTVPTIADLNAMSGPFENFTGLAGSTSTPLSDLVLGTIEADANAVLYTAMGTPRVVNNGFAAMNANSGSPVTVADTSALTFTLTGEQDAFSTDAMLGTTGDLTTTSGTIVENGATDIATGTLAFGVASTIGVTPDGAVAIARSNYDVSVTIAPAAMGVVTAGAAASGSLQPITRNGTTIVFPWTQSASQGAASGTTSVYRFGNLATSASGAVFLEVKNASEAGYMNPGITELSPSIAAGGEFVTNSTTVEAEVGNYGRGDLEFTVEAEPDTLTGRQFVVRDGVIQQVTGGNIQEDLQ